MSSFSLYVKERNTIMINLELTIRDAGRVKGLSVLLLSGEPGVGKTHMAELFQALWSETFGTPVTKLFFQCYRGLEKDKLLYDIHVPNMVEAMVNKVIDPERPTIQEGMLYKAARASLTGKTLLILDELDKASEEIDTLLLDFFQNGRLSDPMFGEVIAKPENLIVIITSNEQRDLNDALYRRMRYVRLMYPEQEKQHIILRKMDKDAYDFFGRETIDLLIKMSDTYRAREVERRIVVNQIARIMSDCMALHSEKDVEAIICQWFSPFETDWVILRALASFQPLVKKLTRVI